MTNQRLYIQIIMNARNQIKLLWYSNNWWCKIWSLFWIFLTRIDNATFTSNAWGCKFSFVSWLWLRSNSVRLINCWKALSSIFEILFPRSISFSIAIFGKGLTISIEFPSNDISLMDLLSHCEAAKWSVKFLLSQWTTPPAIKVIYSQILGQIP